MLFEAGRAGDAATAGGRAMTESEWLASTEPAAMLAWVTEKRPIREYPVAMLRPAHSVKPSDRRLRLFACACCRSVWHLLVDDAPCPSGTGRINRSRRAVEVAMRFADGLATDEERLSASRLFAAVSEPPASPYDSPQQHLDTAVAWCIGGDSERLEDRVHQVVAWLSATHLQLPFMADLLRHLVGNPFRPWMSEAWISCGPEHLRQRVCRATPLVLDLAQQVYDGNQDASGILHDALEDAGAPDELLNHFLNLGLRRMSPHPRGCWALDLLLGKE